MPSLKSLGIDTLSREERLRLVQEIWDSIAAEEGPAIISEAQRDEIRRRVADDDANPDDVIAWENVEARTRERLRRS